MVHRSLSKLFKNHQVREWLLNPHANHRTARQLFTQDNINAAILFIYHNSEDKNASLGKREDLKESTWLVPVAATASYFLCLSFSETFPFPVGGEEQKQISYVRKFVVDKSSQGELTTFTILWQNDLEAKIFINHILDDGTIRAENYDVLVDDKLAVPKVLSISVLRDTGACSYCLLRGVTCTCPVSFKKRAVGRMGVCNTWSDWVNELQALRKRYFSEMKLYEYKGDFSTSVMEIDTSKEVHIYRNVNEDHPLPPFQTKTIYMNGWINSDKDSEEMRVEREKWLRYLSSTNNRLEANENCFSLFSSHSMISDTSRGYGASSVIVNRNHRSQSKSDSVEKVSTCFLCDLTFEDNDQLQSHISKIHCPFTIAKEISKWENSKNDSKSTLSRILNADPSIEDTGNSFFCHVCSQCFVSKRLLKDHIQISHAPFSLNMVENATHDHINIGSSEIVNVFSMFPPQPKAPANVDTQNPQAYSTPVAQGSLTIPTIQSIPPFEAPGAPDPFLSFPPATYPSNPVASASVVDPNANTLPAFVNSGERATAISPSQEEQGTPTGNIRKRKINTEENDVKKQKFYCDRCTASFVTKTNLRKHVRSVHENFKPHACPMCPMSFYQKSDFRRHLQAIHGQSTSA